MRPYVEKMPELGQPLSERQIATSAESYEQSKSRINFSARSENADAAIDLFQQSLRRQLEDFFGSLDKLQK